MDAISALSAGERLPERVERLRTIVSEERAKADDEKAALEAETR